MAVFHLDHHENDIRPVSIDTAWNFACGLYLTMHGQLTILQLVLAVMLSMSMVTSFAKIEVFSENLREMQYNIESIQDFLTILKNCLEPSVYANINSYDVKLEKCAFLLYR